MKWIKSKMEYKGKTAAAGLILTLIFALFCSGSVVYFLAKNQIRNVVMCFVFILLIPLIGAVEKALGLDVPPLFLFSVLFLSAGSILGSCYDFYHRIPWFDTMLHTLAGFLFACLGYALISLVMDIESIKAARIAIVGGILFSLAIGLLWELFEYAGTALFGSDMQEDMLIHEWRSYMLAGNHNNALHIDDITKTIVYFGNGQQLVLNGYLDIGLYDTLNDMLVCMLGSIAFAAVFAWQKIRAGLFYRLMVPQKRVCMIPEETQEYAV